MNDSEDIEQHFDFISRKELFNVIYASIKAESEKRTVLLKGKSGTGKSFVGNKIADFWNSEKDENIALYISGDIGYSQRSYYPLINSMQLLKRQGKLSDHLPGSIRELSRGIPIAGDFVAHLIDSYSQNKKASKETNTRFLNETEKILLFDIETIFQNKNILFVIDNLQYIDTQSLQFIDSLLDSNLLYYSEVVKKIKFLFIYTEEQEKVSERELQNILKKTHQSVLTVDYINRQSYSEVLIKLGCKIEVNASLQSEIHLLTGGNLFLVKRVAEYLSRGESEITHLLKNTSSGDSQADFIEAILLDKLKSLGATGSQVISLLEIASIIGITFTKDEILCISKKNEDELKEIIREAHNADLINNTERGQVFSHEVIRFFFLKRIETRKGEFCNTFAGCLTKLRPSDYFTRANYLFEAGRLQDSIILYIIGVLRNKRDGYITSPVITNRINSFVGDFELGNFLDLMLNAYTYFYQGEFSKAISVIDSIENWFPKELLAEKNFLYSLCKSKSMLEHDMLIAKECLEDWNELKENEAELWGRIKISLLALYANQYDYDSAKKLEKEIVSSLAERVSFDETARYSLNVIRRNAASLHINDTAIIRTQQSVDFFENSSNNADVFYQVPLYLAYINHSANLLVSGDFTKAYEVAIKATALIETYKTISFPEPQICINNFILAGYFSGKLTSEESLVLFEKLNHYKEFVADNFLIQNNIAIINIMNGKLDIAYKILQESLRLISDIDIDSYYYYYLKANEICLRYVMTGKISLLKEWKSLAKHIPQIPDKIFLEKRHQMLERSFTNTFSGWREWNEQEALKKTGQIGKQWAFFGNGFLFTDIQLWHES